MYVYNYTRYLTKGNFYKTFYGTNIDKQTTKAMIAVDMARISRQAEMSQSL